jgi:hypothetical protein
MTPEQFEHSAEFKSLTSIQKEWVVRFIETKDADAATRAAYPCSKNARVLRWKAEKNPQIIAAVELWDGTSLRDSAIAGLKRDIRSLRGVARVEAKKLLFKLQGLVE